MVQSTTQEPRSIQRMRADFRAFVWYLWTQHLSLPQPTRIQYDISHFLQHGERKRFIQAFRGVGKSWLTDAYVVWRLWNNPQLKVMIVSANEDKATASATFIHRLIGLVPVLTELRPRSNQRTSVLSFDVGPALPDEAPSVRAVGIAGQMTGGRADILLSDDVEVPKNSETERMRYKLATLTEEYAAIVKPGAETIYLGTPQSAESIYRNLPAKGFQMRVWPARYPKPEEMDNYLGCLAPLLQEDMDNDPELCTAKGTKAGGVPVDPERFNELDLLEREETYSRSGFMLQFMLNTQLSDADKYPLKLRDLIVMDVDKTLAPVQITWSSGKEQTIEGLPNPGFDGDRYYGPMYVAKDWIEYQGAVMVIDPSGRGRDATGYAVVRMLNGMLYVTRAGGLRGGGYDEDTLRALALIAREQEVNKVLIESNFGDGMYLNIFNPVLNRLYPVSVEEYNVTGQKERRILDKLEPVIAGHRLVVDKGLVERDAREDTAPGYRLFHQLTHITRDRGALLHDDALDALAEAVGYWTKQMATSTHEAEQAYKDKLMQREMEEHLAHQGFAKPRRHRSYIHDRR